jgi:hypothetical protein
MTVTELLPTLRNLSRVDKLRVIQFLVAELEKEERTLLSPEGTYSVRAPHTAFQAADALLAALAADNDQHA